MAREFQRLHPRFGTAQGELEIAELAAGEHGLGVGNGLQILAVELRDQVDVGRRSETDHLANDKRRIRFPIGVGGEAQDIGHARLKTLSALLGLLLGARSAKTGKHACAENADGACRRDVLGLRLRVVNGVAACQRRPLIAQSQAEHVVSALATHRKTIRRADLAPLVADHRGKQGRRRLLAGTGGKSSRHDRLAWNPAILEDRGLDAMRRCTKELHQRRERRLDRLATEGALSLAVRSPWRRSSHSGAMTLLNLPLGLELRRAEDSANTGTKSNSAEPQAPINLTTRALVVVQ